MVAVPSPALKNQPLSGSSFRLSNPSKNWAVGVACQRPTSTSTVQRPARRRFILKESPLLARAAEVKHVLKERPDNIPSLRRSSLRLTLSARGHSTRPRSIVTDAFGKVYELAGVAVILDLTAGPSGSAEPPPGAGAGRH